MDDDLSAQSSYDLAVSVDVPNAETRMALALAQAKELGIVADDSDRFDSAEVAMAYLES